METAAKQESLAPNFSGALKAYFFFTRRYVLVFYAVLAFALVFALLVSLWGIVLTIFDFLTGSKSSGEFEFTLMVLIFFALGFQAIMAFASIAYNLWHITFQKADPSNEFPATLKRMHLIRGYYVSTKNFVVKFLAFLIPGLVVTLILVVPLFAMVLLFTSFITFEQTPTHLLRDIFIPDIFLVWLSVMLMNFNYYLGAMGFMENQ